jgi:hypothetical protein
MFFQAKIALARGLANAFHRNSFLAARPLRSHFRANISLFLRKRIATKHNKRPRFEPESALTNQAQQNTAQA